MNKELVKRVNGLSDYEAFCLIREDFNNRKEEIYKKAFENSKRDLKEKKNPVNTIKNIFYEMTHIEIIF